MRLSRVLLTLSVAVLLAPGLAHAEATRTLRVQLSADAGSRFGVENLAGSLRVTPGSGDAVVAVATVHAESEELAQAVRFEQVAGDKGVPTLRVRYPYDRVSTFRYPERAGHGRTRAKYDDHQVNVSSHSGDVLYADVEVQVPHRALDAVFRTVTGPIEGHDLEGRLRLDTGDGSVSIARSRGDIVADTGSGDVHAKDLEGSFRCDTGSGDCEVSGFRGDRLTCDTGSGQVRLDALAARTLSVDTGSGDVDVRDADVEEVKADTGSGSVSVEAAGPRLSRVTADTGSGSVTLRLAKDAGFEAKADVGSGDLVSRFSDAEPIVKRREVVGYRRGDGHIRINVDTGSGDVVIEPARR